jgi:hypothetical protein
MTMSESLGKMKGPEIGSSFFADDEVVTYPVEVQKLPGMLHNNTLVNAVFFYVELLGCKGDRIITFTEFMPSTVDRDEECTR